LVGKCCHCRTNRVIYLQYTELKLSCGNNPVVKKCIYSNGDVDLWPNDPKINRFLLHLQGNPVAKFGKDPIYRTKVNDCVETCVDALPPAHDTQSHNTDRLETGVWKPYKIILEILLLTCYIFIYKHSIFNIGTTIAFKSWWINNIYNVCKLIVLKKGYTS
jgi:hypothetical protein